MKLISKKDINLFSPFSNYLSRKFIKRNSHVFYCMMKDKFQMVGEKLIDFKLPTSRNKMFSTESLRNKKNMVIVLLRGIK